MWWISPSLLPFPGLPRVRTTIPPLSSSFFAAGWVSPWPLGKSRRRFFPSLWKTSAPQFSPQWQSWYGNQVQTFELQIGRIPNESRCHQRRKKQDWKWCQGERKKELAFSPPKKKKMEKNGGGTERRGGGGVANRIWDDYALPLPKSQRFHQMYITAQLTVRKRQGTSAECFLGDSPLSSTTLWPESEMKCRASVRTYSKEQQTAAKESAASRYIYGVVHCSEEA